MKILFFSHYFPPEVNAPATRTYEHCRRWAEAGHDVTVITCVPNCPDGVAYAGYKNRFRRQVEQVDGIRVVRIWTFLAPNSGKIRRVINYLSYLVSAVYTALWLSRPDVIIATSPQFFCGWAGIWAARLKRRPLILEIRDIWPESIEAVGAMRKGTRTRLLEWLERRMYLAASHIVAVGTGYRDKIILRAPEVGQRVSVITNGVDANKFSPQSSDANVREKFGLGDAFVCSYIGTVGMAHGLEVVVRAASRLRSMGRDDIRFLIVGDGARREELVRLAVREGVDQLVKFTGLLPKEMMPKVLATSDCCLIHLRGKELFGTVIPSKIFETMAMQRPIIMGVRGPALEIVMAAGGGLPMTPDDDQQLTEIVCQMADHPEATREIGQRAREFVIEHYNRNTLAAEYLDLIARVAASR
jgi:glycosyltransferase involved in cell wall biosynthesis